MSRVLIVEDEPAIAELLALHLRHAGFEVAVAGDAARAQEAVDAALPDLVVLDWMLPGASGLSLARRWRSEARTRELPLIMLTARGEERDKVSGLDAGADDYLTKPFSPQELMARIRAVLRRKAPEALDSVVEVAGLRLDPSTRRVTREVDGAVREAKLGPTEFRLLHFLMTHPERVHSRSQLLDRVWGDHVFIEERTVDVHVKRLREALAPVGCAALIETVRGAGYRLTQQLRARLSGHAGATMGWQIPRALMLLAAVVAGMLVGAVLGHWTGWPVLSMVVGGIGIGGIVIVRDALYGEQLLAWLRGPQGTAAPRRGGYWGELAYRIERTLRSREAAIVRERDRREQFLAAIEASPNGVMLLGPREQIEWFNSVAAQHFGLDPERDLQQRATNLIRAPAFVSYLQGGAFDEAVEFDDPRGKSTLSVLVRQYGEGMKLVLSQDITERERAERMRRDFVANVSHEIRTPLTVLAGFVETLAELPLTEVERRRVLALMEQQTGRMQALVADLLTLAQLEGSPRPPPDRWVAVGEMLRRAHADATALSAGRHSFVIEGGADAEVAGSEAELLSAVTNLLNNAVRYTPEGGRIAVSWRWRDEAGGGGAIEVVDNGIGIAREHWPRLTERFYRVDGSRSRDTGGTGLGLAIVKHVMQRHGGEIAIESEPGKGSTFRLVLPALRVRRRVVLPAAATQSSSAAGTVDAPNA